MSLKDYFKESCGCDHDKEKNEMNTTGNVAGFSLPLGYDDTEDRKKMAKISELLEDIKKILSKK